MEIFRRQANNVQRRLDQMLMDSRRILIQGPPVRPHASMRPLRRVHGAGNATKCASSPDQNRMLSSFLDALPRNPAMISSNLRDSPTPTLDAGNRCLKKHAVDCCGSLSRQMTPMVLRTPGMTTSCCCGYHPGQK